jgi:hypothetical protein
LADGAIEYLIRAAADVDNAQAVPGFGEPHFNGETHTAVHVHGSVQRAAPSPTRPGERHALIIGYGMAEGFAGLRIFQGQLRGPTAVTRRARRAVDSAQGHAVEGRGETGVALDHQLPWFQVQIVESELRLVAADVAKQANHPLHGEARRICGCDEGADAALFVGGLVRTRDGEEYGGYVF